MAKSLIIVVAKATFSKATAAGKVEDKAIPEDWIGLKIANWLLGNHSKWQIVCLYKKNVFPTISLVFFWKNLPSALRIYLLIIGQFNMKKL